MINRILTVFPVLLCKRASYQQSQTIRWQRQRWFFFFPSLLLSSIPAHRHYCPTGIWCCKLNSIWCPCCSLVLFPQCTMKWMGLNDRVYDNYFLQIMLKAAGDILPSLCQRSLFPSLLRLQAPVLKGSASNFCHKLSHQDKDPVSPSNRWAFSVVTSLPSSPIPQILV